MMAYTISEDFVVLAEERRDAVLRAHLRQQAEVDVAVANHVDLGAACEGDAVARARDAGGRAHQNRA